MRRTLAFAISLLALGAVTAVGVAWFAAGVMKLEYRGWDLVSWSGRFVPRSQGAWSVSHSRDWGRRAWLIRLSEPPPWPPMERSATLPPAWSRAWQPSTHADRGRAWLEVEFGWPTQWLRFRAEDPLDRRLVDRSELVENGLAIRPLAWGSELGPAALSTDPPGWGESSEAASALAAIPMGVDLRRAPGSILFWALAWLVVLALASMPWRWRDRRRRRRDRCPRCAHPLKSLDVDSIGASRVCPECGVDATLPLPWIRRGMVTAALLIAAITATADALWAGFLVQRHAGAPAIHRAAGRGDLEAVERELARGIAVDLDCRWARVGRSIMVSDSTPLMWAAANGHAACVRRLIDAGAGLEPPTSRFSSRSVFDWAAAGGSVEVMEALVGAGVDPAQPLGDGTIAESALEIAIEHGRFEAVDWLLTGFPHASTANAQNRSQIGAPRPVLAAARSADPRMLPRLLDAWRDRQGSDEALCAMIQGPWRTALVEAAQHDRLDNLRELSRRRGASEGLEQAMAAAASWRRRNACELLRDEGAKPNPANCMLLNALIAGGMADLVEWALREGADPNCESSTHPLGIAVRADCVACARHLLDAGARLDGPAHHPWTSVLDEIQWGRTNDELVETVLRATGSVDRRTTRGQTALMLAARDGSAEWVRRLLERGADPRAVDMIGTTVADHARQGRLFPGATPIGFASPSSEGASPADRRAVMELIDHAIARADASPAPPPRLDARAP